jgi:hypothetical protein
VCAPLINVVPKASKATNADSTSGRFIPISLPRRLVHNLDHRIAPAQPRVQRIAQLQCLRFGQARVTDHARERLASRLIVDRDLDEILVNHISHEHVPDAGWITEVDVDLASSLGGIVRAGLSQRVTARRSESVWRLSQVVGCFSAWGTIARPIANWRRGCIVVMQKIMHRSREAM